MNRVNNLFVVAERLMDDSPRRLDAGTSGAEAPVSIAADVAVKTATHKTETGPEAFANQQPAKRKAHALGQ